MTAYSFDVLSDALLLYSFPHFSLPSGHQLATYIVWTFVVLSAISACILQLFRGYIAKWLYAPVNLATVQEGLATPDEAGEEEAEGGFNGLGF